MTSGQLKTMQIVSHGYTVAFRGDFFECTQKKKMERGSEGFSKTEILHC